MPTRCTRCCVTPAIARRWSSPTSRTTRCALICAVAGSHWLPPEGADEVLDAWAGRWVPGPAVSGDSLRLELVLEPYEARVLILSEPSEALLAELQSDGPSWWDMKIPAR